MSLDPVVLFRGWVGSPDWVLRSIITRYEWKPGEQRAVCMPFGRRSQCNHEEPAPYEPCACGFYGTVRLADAHKAIRRHDTGLIVYGAAIGWGRTLRGPRGVRAEYTRVVALADDSRRPTAGDAKASQRLRRTQLEGFAVRYGVPVVPIPALATYASEFGELLKEEKP